MAMLGGAGAEAQGPQRQEIPTRFAPVELIKRTIQPELSATGRFVILSERGTVLVIDEPDRVAAAATALEKAQVPPPHVRLNLALETGGHPRPAAMGGRSAGIAGPVAREGYVPFPTRYLAPKVSGGGGGGYAVLPAHPTGFRGRAVGQSVEVRPSLNPDGGATGGENQGAIEFSGMVPYGAVAMVAGTKAVIPLASNLMNAQDFARYLGPAAQPVTDSTRISTSVQVTPEAAADGLRLHLLPRLMVEREQEGGRRTEEVLLTDFASLVVVPNGKVVRLDGFAGAPAGFNEILFSPTGGAKGATRIALKAEVEPGAIGGQKPGR